MDWDALWNALRVELHSFAQEVRSSVPSLEVSVMRGPSTQVAPFLANVEFGFPSRYNPTPWGVDLIVQIACGLVGRMGLRNDDGRPYSIPANATGRYAFKCELERGNGELISGLTPIILPADPESDDFQRVAEAFVSRSIGFCRSQIPVIVKTLATHA